MEEQKLASFNPTNLLSHSKGHYHGEEVLKVYKEDTKAKTKKKIPLNSLYYE